MVDVSLSTLPTATPTAVATPGTAAVDGTADGTTPFASLLTTLADPAAPNVKAGGAPVPLAAPLVLADASLALLSAELPDADGKASPTQGKSDPMTALAPDLSAFLASIAPPPKIASIVVRTVTPSADTPAAGANLTAKGTITTTTTVMTQPLEMPPLQVALASARSESTAPIDSASTGQSASLADRVAQAVAAIRALTVRAPEAAASPATAKAAIVDRPATVATTAPANEGAAPKLPLVPVEQSTAPVPPTPLIAEAPTATPLIAEPIQPNSTVLASLPTELLALTAPLGKAPASVIISTAAPATSIAPVDSSAAQADVDDKAVPDTGKRDEKPVLAPDLGPVLAAIAPPPQIAPVIVPAATPQGGPAADGAKAKATPDAMATIATTLRQSVPTASPSMPDAAASAQTVLAEPQTTGDPATIAPDRMAQAFAAVRAMAARAPDAPAPAGAAIVSMPDATPPAAPVAVTVATAEPAPARPSVTPASNAASAPQPSPAPAGQPTAPAPAAPLIATPAVTTTQAADPTQDAAPAPDAPIAPRAPVSVSPAGLADIRRADPAPAAAVVSAVASAETQRPAPARARKAADTAPIGEVRADVAPARIDVASLGQTAPAPLADDPVARQLSIAQDGQWLDSLAKDIAGAGNTNGQLNFRLDPDHLGSLTVQLTQTADGASVRLTASTEAARTILADAQPRLMAEARAQGLTLREATVETRTAPPTPSASANATFSGGGNQGGRSDQGGVAAQLQQQSQQQGGNRQRAPDQPRQAANPAPRAAPSTRSGADLYA